MLFHEATTARNDCGRAPPSKQMKLMAMTVRSEECQWHLVAFGLAANDDAATIQAWLQGVCARMPQGWRPSCVVPRDLPDPMEGFQARLPKYQMPACFVPQALPELVDAARCVERGAWGGGMGPACAHRSTVPPLCRCAGRAGAAQSPCCCASSACVSSGDSSTTGQRSTARNSTQR